MTIRAQIATAPFLALVGFIVAGCGVIPHDGGLAGRCAAIMRQAFPGAQIKIEKQHASAISITDVRAAVTGVRTDLPKKALLARNLAVACRFHNGILIGFRWTRGPEH